MNALEDDTVAWTSRMWMMLAGGFVFTLFVLAALAGLVERETPPPEARAEWEAAGQMDQFYEALRSGDWHTALDSFDESARCSGCGVASIPSDGNARAVFPTIIRNVFAQTAELHMTVTERALGEQIAWETGTIEENRGRFVHLWKRSMDGRWRIHAQELHFTNG